ncbi:MAG: transglycosylase domain-containing protein [Clostridia bacterium]|nr:transglycosylase domain-containing protein [Clostridia bacterium]
MKFIRRIIIFILVIIIGVAFFIGKDGYDYYQKSLQEKSFKDRISEVENNENFIKYDDLSKNYINAVVAVEDHRFFEHGAVDFISIGRAIYTNISNKELQEGGSTITQQVAKNVFFTQEETIKRKSGELFAAIDLEKKLSKEEIFALYVNTAYFGNGYYGIKAASNGYYKKEPKDLNLYEASMLAGVPNAPSIYAPTKNPELAKQRQQHVLRKMIKYGYITQQEAKTVNGDGGF